MAGLKNKGYTTGRISEIFEAIDADGSQEISREEFVQYFIGSKQESTAATSGESVVVNPTRELPTELSPIEVSLFPPTSAVKPVLRPWQADAACDKVSVGLKGPCFKCGVAITKLDQRKIHHDRYEYVCLRVGARWCACVCVRVYQ
jgi:hypothetical protein